MGPGFSRSTLVVTLLAWGAFSATAGCSNGGGGHGAAATTLAPVPTARPAPATTAAVTTPVVAAPARVGPAILAALWEDRDGDGRASSGDAIRVTYDREIKLKAARVDAGQELALPVAGDSLGSGATLEADPQNRARAVVVLGSQPSLHVGGVFSATATRKGLSSGINVSAKPTGQVVSALDDGVARVATSSVDVDGKTTIGFRDAANLVIARGAHESVLLDDGRVLVTGGVRDGRTDAYAEDDELFDPVAGQFTLVSMLGGARGRQIGTDNVTVVGRIRHAATKLADGKVLVTGGWGIERRAFLGLGAPRQEVLASAHVFDPKTGTFERVGSLVHARHSHSATLLKDGRVLIAGGYSDSFWSRNKTLAPLELYDPRTRTFYEEKRFLFFPATTVEKRMNHAAVQLDGGVLLAGGERWEGGWGHFFGIPHLVLNEGSEVFQGGTFARSADLKHARRFPAAALLPTKDVILAGGHDDSALMGSIESWSQATGQWTDVAALAQARTNARIAVLGGEALVVGGFRAGNATASEVKLVETYDASTRKMGTSHDLHVARNGCTATTLLDGRVLVIGGFSGNVKDVRGLDGQPMASCEVFVNP